MQPLPRTFIAKFVKNTDAQWSKPQCHHWLACQFVVCNGSNNVYAAFCIPLSTCASGSLRELKRTHNGKIIHIIFNHNETVPGTRWRTTGKSLKWLKKHTMTDCKFKGHGHPASLTTQDIYRLKATAVEVSRASILIMRPAGNAWSSSFQKQPMTQKEKN